MLTRTDTKIIAKCTLQCAKQVNNCLPPELRDMIYSHLWDDHTMRSIDYTTLLKLSDKPFRELTFCVPAFATEEAVGPVFAREAVHWLYKMCNLGIGRASHGHYRFMQTILRSEDIPAFLTTDAFRVGLTPGDCKISELSVRIQLEDDDKPDDEVANHFLPLISADLKPGFKLHIQIQQWNTFFLRPNTLCTVGKQLQGVITQLGQKQANVAVSFVHRRKTWRHCQSRFTDEKPYILFPDIQGMLGAPEDDWYDFILDEVRKDPDLKLMRVDDEQ